MSPSHQMYMHTQQGSIDTVIALIHTYFRTLWSALSVFFNEMTNIKMVRYVHVHVHHGIEHSKQQTGHIQQVTACMHEILKLGAC